ncbi:hypothetical protein [Priestia endophytica]|uniref:hypothetical protein n=1 Tax=Priestia endophytica TaxID=135735 RepID=UPI000DCA7B97|nr:hypothetical protein [Priestia endophytica]RAS87264.1 hypothetical protein A4U60_06735 [Priestia endophytica]
MKRVTKLFFVPVLLGVFFVGFFNGNTTEAAIANKPGDIIITNSTVSSGLTGHTGIYIDSTTILHTSGRKGEPYPTTISESKWHSRYAHSKVIRPVSSSLGQSAANNAVKYFKGKRIPYSIKDAVSKGNKNLTNTYCSELVYYSYYKAGKNLEAKSRYAPGWHPLVGLVEPYSYTNSEIVSHNGYKFIDNTW